MENETNLCSKEIFMETGNKKLALVTGGSRGIGKAICLRLAKDGMDVVFSYRSEEQAALEVEEACKALGVNAKAIKADASKKEECDMLIKEAVAFGDGKIHVLVNNAGITRDNLLMRMKDEDLDAVVDVNLKGPFYMMRGVASLMLKQRFGSIINMSSVVGLHGNAGQVNYAATKAAVVGMTKSLAKELGSRQVRVNAIAPGMIATDMTGMLNDAQKEEIMKQIPFRAMGQAEDIAAAVSFLASDDSKYITGQVLGVDGGMGM